MINSKIVSVLFIFAGLVVIYSVPTKCKHPIMDEFPPDPKDENHIFTLNSLKCNRFYSPLCLLSDVYVASKSGLKNTIGNSLVRWFLALSYLYIISAFFLQDPKIFSEWTKLFFLLFFLLPLVNPEGAKSLNKK